MNNELLTREQFMKRCTGQRRRHLYRKDYRGGNPAGDFSGSMPMR